MKKQWCVPTAISIITGCPYDVAEQECKTLNYTKHKRRWDGSASIPTLKEVLKNRNIHIRRCETYKNDGGMYLIVIGDHHSSHIITYYDDYVFDNGVVANEEGVHTDNIIISGPISYNTVDDIFRGVFGSCIDDVTNDNVFGSPVVAVYKVV